jgi:hypothetical protein
MRKILLLFILLLLQFGYGQTTYYSRITGNWNSNATWSLTSGGGAVGAGIFPVAGDIVYISNGHTINVNTNVAASSVTIDGGNATSTLTINGTNTLTVTGNITMNSSPTRNQVIPNTCII